MRGPFVVALLLLLTPLAVATGPGDLFPDEDVPLGCAYVSEHTEGDWVANFPQPLPPYPDPPLPSHTTWKTVHATVDPRECVLGPVCDLTMIWCCAINPGDPVCSLFETVEDTIYGAIQHHQVGAPIPILGGAVCVTYQTDDPPPSGDVQPHDCLED